MTNRKSYMGFPTSHQRRFYAASNFIQMGINYLNLSSFWTISTIQDEKSAARFHYIKTVSGKVVAQSIAFRVVSVYWQGDDPFPLKSWLQVTYPLLKAASFDTFCLVAPQLQDTEKEVQLHLTRTRHRLSNEPSSKVLRHPWLPQNGDKVPKFVVFWTISTIKDAKSAAKFHYIKTLSGKVVVQSIAFLVVSIYWQG